MGHSLTVLPDSGTDAIADDIVETSIGNVRIWVTDCEYPGEPNRADSVGIATVRGDPRPRVKPPEAGEPPYLRAEVERRQGRWRMTFCHARYAADVFVVMDPDEKDRKENKARGIKIRALPSRSPLRHELAQVAAKWAAAHPEAFKQEQREEFLGVFDYWVERADEALESMLRARENIGPTLLAARRARLISPETRNETDKGAKALAAAISTAKEAKRRFASSGVMAARQ